MKRYPRTTLVLISLFILSLSAESLGQSGARAVQNLPFSANEWVTKTSIAMDGAIQVMTQQIVLARSSDGTVRREVHEPSVGLNRVVGTPILLISIINEDAKTNSTMYQGRPAVSSIVAPKPQSTSSPATAKKVTVRTSTASVTPETTQLNGFHAVVHRSQYTVPASDPKGKTRTVISELWFSPELRVPLKSSTSDSAGTTTVVILDDINRQEPDAALFHMNIEAKTTQK